MYLTNVLKFWRMTKVWFLVCSSMAIQPRESLLLQQVFWRPLRLVRTLAPTVWVNGFGYVWMCVQLLCFRLFDSNFRHVSSTVWGKVMFLHLCVILFMGVVSTSRGVCIRGGCLHAGGICIQGEGMESASRGNLHRGGGGLGRSPPSHRILWDTISESAFRLVEYILVWINILSCAVIDQDCNNSAPHLPLFTTCYHPARYYYLSLVYTYRQRHRFCEWHLWSFWQNQVRPIYGRCFTFK